MVHGLASPVDTSFCKSPAWPRDIADQGEWPVNDVAGGHWVSGLGLRDLWLGAYRVLRRVAYVPSALRHPRRQLESIRVVHHACELGLIEVPAFHAWKHLGTYLSKDLATEGRRRIVIDHYRWLATHLDRSVYRLWGKGFPIWQYDLPGHDRHYSIELGPATFSRMEGESQILLQCNGSRLFSLSFTLLPGHFSITGGASLLLVGGLQGRFGHREQNRQAARDLAEIEPRALVVLAAQAVADALGLGHVAAVGSDQQYATTYAAAKTVFSYDPFWQSMRATRSSQGLFLIPVPDPDRPRPGLSRAHRIRSRRKAEHKVSLIRKMREAVERELHLNATTRDDHPAHGGK